MHWANGEHLAALNSTSLELHALRLGGMPRGTKVPAEQHLTTCLIDAVDGQQFIPVLTGLNPAPDQKAVTG